jgi:hypothetical protein
MQIIVIGSGAKRIEVKDMKEKQLQVITPYLFEDHLILSLSKDWINYFKKIPTFSFEVKDGKIILTSEKELNVE